MERDHRNYFGQAAQPFVIVSEFELTTQFLRIVFDGFASIEDFDRGAQCLPNLKRQFIIAGDELEAVKRDHHEIFDSIKNAVLVIAGAPADYDLTHLNLLIAKWVLVIQATRKTKDDTILRTKTDPEYHQIIAENLPLVAQVLTVAWQYGKENDEWLNSLSEVTPLKF